MKKFLVGIDFSKNSIHALDYSILFADRFQADITLLWVNNTVSNEYLFDSYESELKQERKHNFEKILKDYRGRLKNGKIDYKLRKGKVHLEFAAQARQINADLIFAGTHGVTGYEEYWIGSNAYRIVTHAPCPVITLRHNFDFQRGIRKILLPIDSSQETREKIPVATAMAKAFDAEIQVLALYTTSVKAIQRRVDKYAEDVISELNAQNVRNVSANLTTNNLTESTLDYARKTETDLIAIMTEQETTTANIFLGPYAQQLINHSTIPILSLRSKYLSK